MRRAARASRPSPVRADSRRADVYFFARSLRRQRLQEARPAASRGSRRRRRRSRPGTGADHRDQLGRLLLDGQPPHREHAAQRILEQAAVLGVVGQARGRHVDRVAVDRRLERHERDGLHHADDRLRGPVVALHVDVHVGLAVRVAGKRVRSTSAQAEASRSTRESCLPEALAGHQAAGSPGLPARERVDDGRLVARDDQVRVDERDGAVALALLVGQPVVVAARPRSASPRRARRARRTMRARSKRPSKSTRPSPESARRRARHRDDDRVDVLAGRQARLGQEARGVAVGRHVVHLGEDLRAERARRAARSSG